jgi:hypothetical protein
MVALLAEKTEENLSAFTTSLKVEQNQDKVPKHTDILLFANPSSSSGSASDRTYNSNRKKDRSS